MKTDMTKLSSEQRPIVEGAYQFGQELAFQEGAKLAAAEKPPWDHAHVDKVAGDRAQARYEKLAKEVEASATINTANTIIGVLDEGGMKEAAEAVSKFAMEALEGVELPAPAEEAIEGEGVSEEDLGGSQVEAAVEGAAEVLAELTGKSPDDPEVQEAAVEIVEEAIEAAQEGGEEGAAAGAVE